MSLPPDKVEKAKKLIDALFKQKKVKVKVIQQIHSFFNIACWAVPPGCPFLHRISNLFIGHKSNNHFVRISKECIKLLQAWYYFLCHFNSTPILPPVDCKVVKLASLF